MTLYAFDKLLRALSAEVEATRGEKSNESCDTCCRAHGEPCTVGRIKVKVPVEEAFKKINYGCEVCSGGGLIKGSKLFKMGYTDKEVKMVPIEVKYCPNCGKELG